MVEIPEKDRQQLERAKNQSEEMLGKSALFMGLYTPEYQKDPVALLQFGLAIIMGKPMYFIVEEGTEVPENVKAVAKGIVYVKSRDTDSYMEATHKIMKMAHAHLRERTNGLAKA